MYEWCRVGPAQIGRTFVLFEFEVFKIGVRCSIGPRMGDSYEVIMSSFIVRFRIQTETTKLRISIEWEIDY